MRNYITRTIALVAFALLTALAMPAFAQAPASLPVQGYLTDSEGAPLDGTAELTFTLYNGSGDAVYTSTQSATLDRGAFSVVLGSAGSPVDLSLFRDNSVLQLGVSVNGGAELSPRFDLATSPFAGFAQYAGDASTLEGLAATDFAQVGQIDFADLNNIPNGVDDGDDDTVAGLNCNAGEVPTWDGAAWACGVTSDTVGDLMCMAGQVAKFDGTGWVCTGEFAIAANLATVAATGSFADLVGVPADLADGDQDTTYTAGTGITLTGTEFSLDAASLDARFVNEGQAGSITSAMIQNNAINSAKVADNSLTAADIAPNAITSSELAADSVSPSTHINWGTNASTILSDCGTFVEVAMCIPSATSMRDCDQVTPGEFCEYDAGCTLLSGSLDNCTGLADVYFRLN